MAVLFWVGQPALANGRHGGGSSVHVTYLEHEGIVQANATATYAAQCPRSRPHPVGGELNVLSATAPQLALAASYPHGQHGWVVVVDNPNNQPQGYFAGIVCVAAKASFAYPRTTAVADAKSSGGFGLDCPRTAPRSINVYFGVQSAADLGKTVLSDNGSGPLGPGVFADVENMSDAPVGLYFGAVCTSLHTGGSETPRSTLAAGMTDGWTLICSQRTPFAVSSILITKGESDTGTIGVVASEHVASGHQWQIVVKSLTNRPVSYFAGIVCIG